MTVSHQRHAADYWQEQINLWQASGMTQKAFCQQHQLALSTFQRWKQQLTGSKPAVTDEGGFIELPLSGNAVENKSGWDIELSLGNGITLRLRQG